MVIYNYSITQRIQLCEPCENLCVPCGKTENKKLKK